MKRKITKKFSDTNIFIEEKDPLSFSEERSKFS